MDYICEDCGTSFSRSYNMLRHKRESCIARFVNFHGGKQRRTDAATTSTPQMWECISCDMIMAANRKAAHLRTLHHKSNACSPLSNGIELVASAFKSRIATYRISSENEHIDYTLFFEEVRPKVLDVVSNIVRVRGALKINLVVVARYVLPTQDNMYSDKSFNTCNEIVTAGSDLDEVYGSFVEAMKVQSSEFQEKDSGML